VIYWPFSDFGFLLPGYAGLFQGDLADGLSLLGLNTYEAATKLFNKTSDGNRLVTFYNRATEVGNKPDQNIFAYSGGPGAVLGIGKTNIKFAGQRTGLANPQSISNPGQFYLGGVTRRSYQTEDLTKFQYQLSLQNNATSKYGQLYLTSNEKFKNKRDREFLFEDPLSTSAKAIENKANGPQHTFNYKVDGLVNEINSFTDDETGEVTTHNTQKFIVNSNVLYKNNSRTYSQPQLIGKENVIEGGQAGLYPTDFRKELYTASLGQEQPPTTDATKPTQGGSQQSTVLSISPSYRDKNIDVRFNMGSPGKEGGELREGYIGKKNVWNYGLPANQLQALDKITAAPMYNSTGPNLNDPINDAVKFRIAAINNDRSDGEAVYMHFRAFLDNFSDNYEATWNAVNYVGRGESLYNYGGFSGRNV